jgi:3-phenylpropionate/trans-cinnamate dioxygenase ferredoxin reductase component
MNEPRSVLIIGAGLAGARCAETLRAEGYSGRVTLVGEEPIGPYERPTLSKEFLAGERSASQLLLRPPDYWSQNGIDLVLGRRIDAVRRRPGEVVVIATGARARRTPLPGVGAAHVLRTLADAVALRQELRPGRRLAVVGGGFVAAEVASTARRLGVNVTVLEAGAAPFATTLGLEVGDVLAHRYRQHGVELRTGTTVIALAPRRVALADGSDVECDAVLLAVGAEPARELVRPDFDKCGDVGGGPGHWATAAADGAAAARRILGLTPLPKQPPYFWSDQFGLRLQLVGDPSSAAAIECEGSEGSFAARYFNSDGQLVAALAANRSEDIVAFRRELACAA